MDTHTQSKLKIFLLFLLLLNLQSVLAQNWITAEENTTDKTADMYTIYGATFIDDTTAVAVGDIYSNKGIVKKSTDGGSTWTTVATPSTALRTVVFASDSVGFAGGKSGALLKTTDKGDTWTAQSNLGSNYLFAMHFPSDSIGYVIDYNRNAYKTTDGGENWNTATAIPKTNYPKIYGCYFTNDTIGYACATGGRIYKTTDGASGWTKLTQDITTGYLTSIKFFNDSVGLTCGQNGIILKTTDSGETWTQQTTNTSNFLWSLEIIGDSIAYAVSSNAACIIKTTDQGETWTTTTLPSTSDRTYAVAFSDEYTGIAVGYRTYGLILKLNSLGISATDLDITASAQDTIITTDPMKTNTSWSLVSNDSWISVSPVSGTDSASFTLSAEENVKVASRTGSITVTSDLGTFIINVTQAGVEAVTVGTSKISFTAEAQDSVVAMTTVSGNYRTAVSSDDSWLTVTPATEKGSGDLTISATANTTIQTRTDTITVTDTTSESSKTIIVTQASSAYITFTTDTIYIDKTGTVESLSVSSNCEWAISSADTSIVQIDVDTVTGDKTVNLTISENTGITHITNITIAPVTANTGLSSTKIFIYQTGVAAYLTVSQDTIELYNEGQYIYDTTWIYSNAAWKASGYTSKTGNCDGFIGLLGTNPNRTLTPIARGTLTITTTNTTDTTITITIPVIQPGVKAACLFADSCGSSITFKTDSTWITESSAEWLVVSPANGTGNGTLSYSADDYDGDTLRTAVAYIKDSLTGTVLYKLTVVQVSDTPIELNNSNINEFYNDFGLESLKYPNKANFLLTEDITIPWTKAFGASASTSSQISWGLAGHFNGGGHSVTVEMNTSTNGNYMLGHNTAMFRILESTGKISNLRVDGYRNNDEVGYDYEGILTAVNNGLIENVAIYASLYGGKFLGAFSGSAASSGTLKNSYCTGTITGTDDGNYYGCLGTYIGTLTNCMMIGEMGDENVQGYPTCGSYNPSGVFYNYDSLLLTPYSDEPGIGLSTAEMIDSMSVYKNAGWDISDSVYGSSVWYMVDGEDYPRLRWEMAGPVNLTTTEGGETTIEPYRKGLYLNGTTITVMTSSTGLNYKFRHFVVNDSIITDEIFDFDITEEININAVYEFVPYLTTSKVELSVADTAGSTDQFTISSDIPWTIESSDSWISVNITEGSGDTSIIITAEANPYITERTATLTISSDSLSTVKTITVVQEAGDPSFSTETDSITVDAVTTSASTNITANTDWSVIVSEDWLSINPESGSGDAVISISFDENEDTAARSAFLIISMTEADNDTIIITQQGADPYIATSTQNLTIGAAENSSVELIIYSNISWTVAGSETWLSADVTSGTGQVSVKISADENPAAETRTAYITVSADGLDDITVTVTQEAADPEFTISRNSLETAAAGDTVSIIITANSSWTISTDADWITASPLSGSGDTTITIIVAANSQTTSRTADITVAMDGTDNQTITITQKPGAGTGTEDYTSAEVSVYPNPAKDKITIVSPAQTDNALLIDSQGKTYKLDINNSEFDISEFAPGIYYLQLYTDRHIVCKKIEIIK